MHFIDRFTKDGKFLMLALDHRGSFKKLINPENPESVLKERVIQLKKEIIDSIKDQMSGLLIDVDYGLMAYSDHATPYLLPVEKSGYTDQDGERITELEYSVEQLKEMGASGAKLLIYLSPYSRTSQHQLSTANQVLKNCQELNFPFFLEIVTYGSNTEGEQQRSKAVLDSLKMFVSAGIVPDVWKLEYPGNLESCMEITKLVDGTPWILLTRGDSFETFMPELKDAARAGCQGFLAGRALWQEGLKMDHSQRSQFFLSTLPERFKKISKIVLGSGGV